MKTCYQTLEYIEILEKLSKSAISKEAKELCHKLEPFYNELQLRKEMRDTTQAKILLNTFGNPPLPLMEHIDEYIKMASKGDLLSAYEISSVGTFLVSVGRMKQYLEKGCLYQVGLSFYHENLFPLKDLQEEIARSIRNEQIDDFASPLLHDIRRELIILEEKIKSKAEAIMKSSKMYMAENFVVTRNGKVCLPVKKDCKSKVNGSVIDSSSSGSTLFIEPTSVCKLQEEYDLLKIDEDNEERRILYTLMCRISDNEEAIILNIRTLIHLDFVFAKGKLSIEMDAVEPVINNNQYIHIVKGRHPSLSKENCVPLDFELGSNSTPEPKNMKKGMIITGPNTGGKTVTIKTVGLFCLMACSGLHIPCTEADICMVNQVLCDIGDGQNISDNLSTFSSHISNIITILKKVTKESFVILDELGSGTDPAEGMGIAISIIEQLRRSGCLFLITTHYPDVKTYAEEKDDIMNARMAFDRDNLRPEYRLEVGKSGESCALYIAKHLGLPDDIILYAERKAYRMDTSDLEKDYSFTRNLRKDPVHHIERIPENEINKQQKSYFNRGDSVTIDGKIGIVVKPSDDEGNVLIQMQKEKILINHKRLKLKVAASALYPDNYDFSVIFDTVANRKARHQMEKGHFEGYEVALEEN